MSILLVSPAAISYQNSTYKKEEVKEWSNTCDYFWCTHFKLVIEFMIIDKINSRETSVIQEMEKNTSPGWAPYSAVYKTPQAVTGTKGFSQYSCNFTQKCDIQVSLLFLLADSTTDKQQEVAVLLSTLDHLAALSKFSIPSTSLLVSQQLHQKQKCLEAKISDWASHPGLTRYPTWTPWRATAYILAVTNIRILQARNPCRVYE